MSKLTCSQDQDELHKLISAVRAGDKAALESLLRALKDDIYGIALRMVAQPADAEDVTQEVLLKVITRLDSFRGDSSPRTWAYRIAVNHILDKRKSRVEQLGLDFEAFGKDLLNGLSEPANSDQELAYEVKLGCTLAMLTCLDREHRVAYVLGEVFDLPGNVAAEIADVSQEVYRQRLSRARNQLEGFTEAFCGVVNPANTCSCQRRVLKAIELGRVNRENLVFSSHPTRALKAKVEEMDQLHSIASLMRSHPDYAAPDRIISAIRDALHNGSLSIFRDSALQHEP